MKTHKIFIGMLSDYPLFVEVDYIDAKDLWKKTKAIMEAKEQVKKTQFISKITPKKK